MAASTRVPRWARWLIGAVVAVAVLVVGGTFVYIHFIQGPAPAPLSLSTTTTPETTAPTAAPGATNTATTNGSGSSSSLAGTWNVGSGSTAGYRVKETLFGQSNTAVGRTNKVTGSMTIAGAEVTKAQFSVDMTSVATVGNSIDGAFADRRDGQFQTRIMDTTDFPTATFELSSPIALAPIPKDGTIAKYSATGKLTMHGTTKTVTIPLTARRTAGVIGVQGIVPITFADYGINNPSGGPASVGDVGQMEFLLQLQPA